MKHGIRGYNAEHQGYIMKYDADVRRRIETIKEILLEQEILNKKNRTIKKLKETETPKVRKRVTHGKYRTGKRRYRAEELIEKGTYTRLEVLEILKLEFPEYKKISHDVLIHYSKIPKRNTLKNLVVEEPDSGIISFELDNWR